MKISCPPLLLFFAATAGIASRACDLCGCYTPQLATVSEMDSATSTSWLAHFYGGVGEQFTRFATLLDDGREVSNPTGQYENSSITQLVAGYRIDDRFALQLDLPLIYRDFKRPEGFAVDRGSVSGLGDVSLLLNAVAFHYATPGRRTFAMEGKDPVAIEHEPDFTLSAILLAGIKFPTGNPSRLHEEFHEVDVPGAPPSAIHGHDLTLGTGSNDGIFGEQSSLRYKNVFFETNVQFTLRGDGAYQYHFANDLTWNAGPGYYLIRRPETIVGLQFVVSGEYKNIDRFRGSKAEDTGITAVALGPRIVGSRGRFSAEVAADFPVLIHNTALQAVPDYRLHAGVSVHF